MREWGTLIHLIPWNILSRQNLNFQCSDSNHPCIKLLTMPSPSRTPYPEAPDPRGIVTYPIPAFPPLLSVLCRFVGAPEVFGGGGGDGDV